MPTSDPRVLVLGAGSIGSRHARNLAADGARVDIADPDPARADDVTDGIHFVPYDLDHLDRYDGIVVASPTSLHAIQAVQAVASGAHVLVEKPLATSIAEAAILLAGPAARVMVGYNLRFYDPVVQFFAAVHGGAVGSILGARAWFGSYLPDWRPAVDYRTTYSASAARGGGVLLDAIHEIDLLTWLLPGGFEVLGALVARVGDLEIDSEDTVKALLRHETGVPVELSLDYLSRTYQRGLEVLGSNGNVRLDWATRAIDLEADGRRTAIDASWSIDDSYVRETRCFLDWIRGGTRPPCGLAEGAESLRLADAVRSAAT